MSRRPGDLVAAVVIAAICGAMILLIPGIAGVRLLAALPLLFVLPGYTITSALFPKRTLGIPEQVLFSVGISVAVVIVRGFALHWTPWGLHAGSWVGLLFCVILLASLVAAKRWQKTGPIAGTPSNFAFDGRQGLLLGLAALVMTAAVLLARTPLPPQGIQGYTQFWMLPAGDENPGVVRLGINSLEFTPTEYRVQVLLNGEIVDEWSGVQLRPGGKWEKDITLPADSAGSVEAMLYRLDAPDNVYRRVTLQLEH